MLKAPHRANRVDILEPAPCRTRRRDWHGGDANPSIPKFQATGCEDSLPNILATIPIRSWESMLPARICRLKIGLVAMTRPRCSTSSGGSGASAGGKGISSLGVCSVRKPSNVCDRLTRSLSRPFGAQHCGCPPYRFSSSDRDHDVDVFCDRHRHPRTCRAMSSVGRRFPRAHGALALLWQKFDWRGGDLMSALGATSRWRPG